MVGVVQVAVDMGIGRNGGLFGGFGIGRASPAASVVKDFNMFNSSVS